MKSNTIKSKHIAGIITALFSAGFLALVLYLNLSWSNIRQASNAIQYVRAKVIEVVSEETEIDSELGLYQGTQTIKVKILAGEHKGEEYTIDNHLESRIAVSNIHLKKNMTFIACLSGQDSNFRVDVFSHYRLSTYIGVLVVFFGILLIIGGRKGVMSALGLVFTILCVFFLFLPLIFKGFSPVFAAIITGLSVAVVSLSLLNGFSKKTIAAILGTALGVTISGLFAIIIGKIANITIYNSEEAETIMVIAKNYLVKPQGILFAGVIIAALGAVMDISISIASSVCEMAEISVERGMKKLFSSGMNVAKDMVGTMTNTLILAFVGSAIALIVILYISNISLFRLLNSDILGVEILQALSGAIGVLCTAPITAYITSLLLSRGKETEIIKQPIKKQAHKKRK